MTWNQFDQENQTWKYRLLFQSRLMLFYLLYSLLLSLVYEHVVCMDRATQSHMSAGQDLFCLSSLGGLWERNAHQNNEDLQMQTDIFSSLCLTLYGRSCLHTEAPWLKSQSKFLLIQPWISSQALVLSVIWLSWHASLSDLIAFVLFLCCRLFLENLRHCYGKVSREMFFVCFFAL